jgi:hypothetical protein
MPIRWLGVLANSECGHQTSNSNADKPQKAPYQEQPNLIGVQSVKEHYFCKPLTEQQVWRDTLYMRPRAVRLYMGWIEEQLLGVCKARSDPNRKDNCNLCDDFEVCKEDTTNCTKDATK